MLFLQYDASGNITGRYTITDSSQMANYSNTLATSIGMHDRSPEVWARVLSDVVRLIPTSSTVTGTIAIVGAAAEAEVNSVGCTNNYSGSPNANTPRAIMSFRHALTLVGTQQANAALYLSGAGGQPALLVYSAGFTSSDLAATFSASVVTSPAVTSYNLKLALTLIGLNMNVSSRVLITQDGAI